MRCKAICQGLPLKHLGWNKSLPLSSLKRLTALFWNELGHTILVYSLCELTESLHPLKAESPVRSADPGERSTKASLLPMFQEDLVHLPQEAEFVISIGKRLAAISFLS